MPQPQATIKPIFTRMAAGGALLSCLAASSALAGATNNSARHAYAATMRGSRNPKPLYNGTRIPNAATMRRMTTACLAIFRQLRIRRRARIADQVLRVLLVLLADVFHQLFLRPETSREGQREGLRIVARIDDRHLILKRP